MDVAGAMPWEVCRSAWRTDYPRSHRAGSAGFMVFRRGQRTFSTRNRIPNCEGKPIYRYADPFIHGMDHARVGLHDARGTSAAPDTVHAGASRVHGVERRVSADAENDFGKRVAERGAVGGAVHPSHRGVVRPQQHALRRHGTLPSAAEFDTRRRARRLERRVPDSPSDDRESVARVDAGSARRTSRHPLHRPGKYSHRHRRAHGAPDSVRGGEAHGVRGVLERLLARPA